MARPLLEIQRDLNDFLTRNRERINAYHDEMRFMLKMDEDDPLRDKMKPEIILKYADVVFPMAALGREREDAYHEQKDSLSKTGKKLPDKAHMRKLIDAQHPDNPFTRRTIEDWRPGQDYGPGGRLQSPKVIVIPN
jgi:hypothetical protein